MLFELAKQPALQDQLCQEIKAVLGDKVNPSWEDLQNIPLVRHCLKETLRLYPPVQINARTMSVSGLLSLSNEYEEADKFIPERWSKDKVHPFTSLPFGFEQRGCYGN